MSPKHASALSLQGAIFLIDKPPSITSHDVIARLRRMLGIRRIGHAGTLDPMATGLLVVAAGPATRLLQYLSGMDKDYTGTFRLGGISTTFDALGEISMNDAAPLPNSDALKNAAAKFVGEIEQIPPAFSAIKIAGRKSYELARQGQVVEMKSRRVTIESFEITDYAPPEASFSCRVSSGTYIRSLANDVGQVLGCGAYLTALRRTRVGTLSIEEAQSLDEENFSIDVALTPVEALRHMPRARVRSADAIARLRHGGQVRSDEMDMPPGDTLPQDLALLDHEGNLIAVAERVEGPAYQPNVVLPEVG